ncbi:alpha-ketoglutarate-dependent dioxygenase AlkB [Allokutzneria sp. A3M-2-11 16]|uniref:alpha-ketoglutarate-dependent dioxygenase AlkB n=1 Tax=Allokutzneria sp. A3M-2-11 16 TaxID=2962043 RepID=UPI0020B68051|nr:alpha-ketoglutarate-dependent dioxygenase AlkB [Allokutzneria sp. A3M-2-11 16]MCP3804827.1 alpha-ketoglutarate-dependent dioxygenase AlkB [Allokutzneria sp. A3M-2-11 16]
MTTLVEGLIYQAGWLTPGQQRELLSGIDAEVWSSALRRRVQHYGHRYDYGRRAVTAADSAPPLPVWSQALAARLHREGFMADLANQAIVNEYLPGQGISAHVDCVPCFGPQVAAISIGSACTMDFSDPDNGERVPVRLEPGSLCVMTGAARYRWRHAIAARKSDPTPTGRQPRGRRVSITFRTVLSAATSG